MRRTVGEAPVLVGSGLTDANAERLLEAADGAIVGSAFKPDGRLEEPIDPERVRRLRELLDGSAEGRCRVQSAAVTAPTIR